MIEISGEVIVSGGLVLVIAGLIFGNNKHLENKFVNKDVCKIVSKNLADDVKEVKKKVDCIPKIKAGMDQLLIKNGLPKTDE